MKVNKITLYGLLLAVAFILSYVESLVPTPPGIKLGIANMVVLFALYYLGVGGAFLLSVIRVLLVSFTFGNLFSLAYSMTGALLSLLIMIILKKSNRVGTVGVSVAGAVMHNLGQVIVAVIVVKRLEVAYYYPIILFSGIIAGIMVGLLAALVLKRMKKLLPPQLNPKQ